MTERSNTSEREAKLVQDARLEEWRRGKLNVAASEASLSRTDKLIASHRYENAVVIEVRGRRAY